jgi:glycogen debranching enzyme
MTAYKPDILIPVFLLAGCLMTGCTSKDAPRPGPMPESKAVGLSSLGIEVSAAENRPVSFSNKRSAYFYTQSHRNDHEEHAGFSGFNIAQRRAFSAYAVEVAGERLDPALAAVTVYPDRMTREWPSGVRETLRLFDNRDVLEVQIEGANETVTVTPLGEGVDLLESKDGVRIYSAMEPAGRVIAAGHHGNRHYIVVADSVEAVLAEFKAAEYQADAWREQTEDRLESLLGKGRFVAASDPQLQRALRWLMFTTDQLVTRQRGDGIYAGLPWFNEYWGRDSFIALPGALLVTGEFETARAVLTSFAEFMEMDPDSKFYGRVPNIVRPDLLDYHTTDGTPRFVIALLDYVRYSGDASIIAELFPEVRASIEGALKNWTDENAYLTHEENETWMDARRASDLAAYSPRDTRANDIQALWHGQLLAGVHFAKALDEAETAQRWQETADRLARNFERDFISPEHDYLADRLQADGEPDFRLRPNQFYAFDLIADQEQVARATRSAWQALVYPWGVASLSADDPFFHPYHLARDRYHKDQAYHNGTVWLWNNGIAMQRMVELGQVDPAWALFQNMNRMVLEDGVVGGLGENTDAWPHPGEDSPRLTGTYLQAWSNTEQLRAWYRYFLGVRPDMIEGVVTLAPRLPEAFGMVSYTARVGEGWLDGEYEIADGSHFFRWRSDGFEGRVSIELPGFEALVLKVSDGDRVHVLVSGNRMQWHHLDHGLQGLVSGMAAAEPTMLERQARIDRIFEGVGFAQPGDTDMLPVMQQALEGDR